MKIRVVGHSGESQFSFGESGPWCEFKDELLSQGHEICNSDFGTTVDALISHKHSDAALKEAIESGVPKSRRALVLWEPEIVEKERYSKEVLEEYGIVYAPSPIWAKKVSGKSFNWPQDKVESIEPLDDWVLRKNKFIIIQGNKFSARKGELYSLRRQVIKSLKTDVDLFGTNWNRGFTFDWLHWSMSAVNSTARELSLRSIFGAGRKYKNYLGISTNKRSTFSKYRLAIVIENSPDFVSEKLFDAISAGCLVIYVGPSLADFAIDDRFLVLGNQEKSYVIKNCIRILQLNDIEQYQIASSQNKSLKQEENKWRNDVVLRFLAHSILTDMK